MSKRTPVRSLALLKAEITQSVLHARVGGYEFGATENCGVFHIGRGRGVDVLILSRYPLRKGDKDDIVDYAKRQNPQIACWPYFCLDRHAIEGVDHDYRAARTDRLVSKSGGALPWSEWMQDAVRLLRPKTIVMMTWKGQNRIVEGAWPFQGFPDVDAPNVFKVEEPKTDIHQFRSDWDKVEAYLRENMLLGCKRTADGNVDALRVLMENRDVSKRARKDEEQQQQQRPSGVKVCDVNNTIGPKDAEEKTKDTATGDAARAFWAP